MMAEYKFTPLELDGQLPKELYKIIEDRWHFCLKTEKEIRESSLARLLPDLTKSQIENAVKRHNNRFTPKSILQNKIEEVVNNSTRLWKVLYKKIDVFLTKSIRKRKLQSQRRLEKKGEREWRRRR